MHLGFDSTGARGDGEEGLIMDHWDIYIFVLFGIAGLVGVLVLVKKGTAKKNLRLARALVGRDDAQAVELFRKALGWANEEPALERVICDEIAAVYERRAVRYAFADFLALVDQSEALSKRDSRKSMNGLRDVLELKGEMIALMPEIRA
ncbi:MAG: hypothetical protein ABIK09_02080 [Pseudomonadota bacterium]